MSYLDLFRPIKAFVFDVDGVLTDGKVVLLPDGQQMRTVNSKDGYALQLAVRKEYHVAIITGGNNLPMKERMNGLGITDTYLSSSHKNEAMDDFLHSYHLKSHEVMYMGDDIPDLPALEMVGLPSAPLDASEEVKSMAKFISKRNGGNGCVREIIELVMRAHGKWYDASRDNDNFAEFTW
ncbi:MAG: HAD hydrolase family protein [Flavobacteriales bacterium]|jgi:3-deoxy-D-manno-octulosonate 8-phosphate phosphatase (KDO 8-P phosphatase)|nr:HAD hydrolase family protein [Flavobacteriales bacterium]NCG29805.1 HAD hydrolase family protein [Bacteroidota bacterium]MBT3963586.1 HAD hydrolase family protein [Flavobacteriales bacterium]MBT4705683.1 HAD hydrolase family protein [Flavobacteriales bacterium]MBT4930959.1 HAD hydrolase family protein [Flavobacteriales bacterium]